ncbi:MAG: nitroreductase family protein [Deltaproteobacteria bacterium]|nr:nitroreductase family protein [Candidatus Anaeroferrophillus wilburensis]MBN2888383.1 nitroreductase family protein [Deltaproteobacteria bacterium]
MAENNQVLQTIAQRRSVRRFAQQTVSDQQIDILLEAGRLSPSGLNNQPWRFAVVRQQELKTKFAQLTNYQAIITSAPVLVVVLLDTTSLYHREKDIQSVGACLQNILLAAHSLQLGAVWLGEILKNGPQVVELLQLPAQYELMAVVAVGHPAPDYQPKPAVRKPLADLILYRDPCDG